MGLLSILTGHAVIKHAVKSAHKSMRRKEESRQAWMACAQSLRDWGKRQQQEAHYQKQRQQYKPQEHVQPGQQEVVITFSQEPQSAVASTEPKHQGAPQPVETPNPEPKYRLKRKSIPRLIIGGILIYMGLGSIALLFVDMQGLNILFVLIGVLYSIIGFFFIINGLGKLNIEKRSKKYVYFFNDGVFNIKKIAKSLGEDCDVTLRNIETLFEKKYFEGYINRENLHIVITNN